MTEIINGKIITPNEIIVGKKLLIDNDKIVGIVSGSNKSYDAENTIDANGCYIMPGIIDVHSDNLEQYVQPRPTSQVDFEFALKVCERSLLGAGITTMYHSIALFKDEFFGKSPLRTKENVQKIADLLASIHKRDHLIRHRFHLRVEIDNLEAFDITRDMIEQGKVHQISFMDHTPGQGQYKDLALYYETVSGHKGREVREMNCIDDVLRFHDKKEYLSFDQLNELARLAHENGLPVASHDDDCEEKLALNKDIGVDISEFPIALDVAKSAKMRGFYTVVGAPNILRGSSHAGNMSAAKAVLEECADILCSDYYPASILHSVFLMYTKHGVPLPQMVNRATLNPAKAMKIDKEYGSIESGKKADLLVVDVLDKCPVITHVFVDGRTTSRIEYRR